MAQNVWLNAVVDAAMSKKPDLANHQHAIVGGTSASGDATFSFDNTKITTQTQARSVLLQILQALGGRGLPL